MNRREYKKSATESGLQLSTNGDRTELDEVIGDEAGLEDGDHVPLPEVHSPTKSHKHGKGKAQGKSHKKRQDPVPVEEDAVEADEAGENGDEDEDDSADAADPAECKIVAHDKLDKADSRTVAIREQALHNFQLLAEQFAALRSSIHSEKIAEAEAELAQLQQPHPIHPEFIRQLQAVTARRDTKIQQEMKLHEYKKETLRHSTLASRAQLLSQYMQDAREVRERILYELGKQWYDIQKERRAMQADDLDSFGQVFSTKRSVQVRQQAKYNTEVSILSGIAKYVGFPAAPEIVGMPPKDIHDDMKAIRAKVSMARSAHKEESS